MQNLLSDLGWLALVAYGWISFPRGGENIARGGGGECPSLPPLNAPLIKYTLHFIYNIYTVHTHTFNTQYIHIHFIHNTHSTYTVHTQTFYMQHIHITYTYILYTIHTQYIHVHTTIQMLYLTVQHTLYKHHMFCTCVCACVQRDPLINGPPPHTHSVV